MSAKELPFPGNVPIIGESGVAITFVFAVPPGITAQEFTARLLSNHITVAAGVSLQFLKTATVSVRPLTDLLNPSSGVGN